MMVNCCVAITLCMLLVLGGSVSEAKIESKVLRALANNENVNVFVRMKTGAVESTLSAFKQKESSFESRGARLESLKNALEETATKSQKKVIAALNSFNSAHESSFVSESFWITNAVFLAQPSKALLHHLAALDEVASIEAERVVSLEVPLDASSPPKGNRTVGDKLEWGLEKVKTKQTWDSWTNGAGVVVANIDTGVLYTHEALKDNYRSEYGWFDPYDGTANPIDGNGHGTHTMGTIAGTNGIGVAPGAKWIACRGCGSRSCTEKALLGCGQWTACPTDSEGNNKKCSMAPNLVSNSWGGGQGDSWYNDVIKVWHESGIIPIFAMGNAGPSCGTANSPGDNLDVIGVGATDVSDALASFSSVGPRKEGGDRMKPDVAAPGKNVNSAWNSGDSKYRAISGTSMACPHTAGVVALMLSYNPDLTYQQIYDALTMTTDQTSLVKPGKDCGGVSEDTYPNNMFGYGRINAFSALKKLSGGGGVTPKPTTTNPPSTPKPTTTNRPTVKPTARPPATPKPTKYNPCFHIPGFNICLPFWSCRYNGETCVPI